MQRPASPQTGYQDRPAVIAHRGASIAEIENTIAAFDAAVARGADAIELDIRWTRDAAAVVFHDHSVVRDGRKVAVKRLAAEEFFHLKAADGLHVLTLREALLWAKNKAPLVFDIKDARREEAFIDLVAEHGFHPESVFSSFRLTVIGKLMALRPDWNTAWIIGKSGPAAVRRLLVKPIITRAVRWGAGALHFHHHWIAPELLAQCKKEGLKVAVWTVDAPSEIRRFADLGVDAIITNEPDKARQALGKNTPAAGE